MTRKQHFATWEGWAMTPTPYRQWPRWVQLEASDYARRAYEAGRKHERQAAQDRLEKRE